MDDQLDENQNLDSQSGSVELKMFRKAAHHAKQLAHNASALISILNQSELTPLPHVRPHIEALAAALQEYDNAVYACGKCGSIKRDHKCLAPLTIQDYIDRGWIECPQCDTSRGVDKKGNVLSCGKCSDVFRAQAAPWNLFVTLH